jgi:pimeloyl-ACP methyl ester carboxylesterase
MEIRAFEAHRRDVTTELGELSYIDIGRGPTALFVHGVVFNAYLWRNVIEILSRDRRCIAVDLPAHGHSVSGPDDDLSLRANAKRLDALCETLGIDSVDLVGNDTGGALSQIFSVRYRERVRTLTLTNTDAHNNLPPEQFKEGKELAAAGKLGALVGEMARNPDLARTAERGFNLSFEHPELLSDEIIDAYIGVFKDPARAAELDRFAVSTTVDDLLAVEPGLAELTAPTLIVWGTGDVFFEVDWAYWLRDHIPGTKEVIEIEGGKLLFPTERAGEFVPHLRRFLAQYSPVDSGDQPGTVEAAGPAQDA